MLQRLEQHIQRLIDLPSETEWVEFKVDKDDPQEIGEYISALSNAAALHDHDFAYLIWGVADKTHEIVGTKFDPRKKVGNQELESWLLTLLNPRIDFKTHEITLAERRLVVFRIPAARSIPVSFGGVEYIRVGSYKVNLRQHPEKERELWRVFESRRFERDVAAERLSEGDVLSLLDHPGYFELTGQVPPSDGATVVQRLVQERFVVSKPEGYSITNLGALLFARDLSRFDFLSRKMLRIIIYDGTNKLRTTRERVITKGYAVGFAEAVGFINDQLPLNEHIGQAFREEQRMYPSIAIRELVANALIHQDFAVTGSGPVVDIYTDRIEISNPGVPLVDTLRFIDQPPRSRNEDLASFMRRINLCEERGSGIDKVVFNVELFQLPPPDFRVSGDNTIAALFAPKKLAAMDAQERIRACYQHACLCYVSSVRMTNTTLRTRFAIADKNYAIASRIIAETLRVDLIKPFDPENTSKRQASYLPFWA